VLIQQFCSICAVDTGTSDAEARSLPRPPSELSALPDEKSQDHRALRLLEPIPFRLHRNGGSRFLS
jgi:hypothetical protein